MALPCRNLLLYNLSYVNQWRHSPLIQCSYRQYTFLSLLRFIENDGYSVNYSLSLNNLFIQIFPQSYSVEIGIQIVVDGYDGCLRANEFTDLLQRLNRCMAGRMVVVVSLASFQARCRTCNQGLNKCICFLIISAQPFST